jgi:hypothetical protein
MTTHAIDLPAGGQIEVEARATAAAGVTGTAATATTAVPALR